MYSAISAVSGTRSSVIGGSTASSARRWRALARRRRVLANVDLACLRVDVLDAQPADFAAAESDIRTDADAQRVAFRVRRLDELLDFLDGQRLHVLLRGPPVAGSLRERGAGR